MHLAYQTKSSIQLQKQESQGLMAYLRYLRFAKTERNWPLLSLTISVSSSPSVIFLWPWIREVT